MSKTITQNEKAEFKRFFEYAFQTSFDLWPDFPELAEVFSKKVRGSEEERKYNIAISKVIQSKDALFGILGYGALAMDEKLRYYAYLFLKDHGITDEALIGYGIDIPRLKTVDELYDEMFSRDIDGAVPAKLIPVFDNPQILLDILRDQKEEYHTRDTALNRLRQLCPLTAFPAFVFTEKTFTSGKNSEWDQKSRQFSPYKEAYAVSRDVTKEEIVKAVFQSIADGNWELFRFHVEGAMRDSGEKIYFTMKNEQERTETKIDSPSFWERFFAALLGISAVTYVIDEIGVPSAKLLGNMKIAEKIIDEVWAKYKKENNEFLVEFEKYNKGFSNIDFYSASLSLITDFTKDKKYIELKDSLGEEVTKQLWNDPVKLIEKLIETSDVLIKKTLLTRLQDIAIITAKEWKEIRENLIASISIANLPLGESFAEGFDFLGLIKAIGKFYGIEIIKGISEPTAAIPDNKQEL